MKTRRGSFKTSMSGEISESVKAERRKIELTAETDGLLKVDKKN